MDLTIFCMFLVSLLGLIVHMAKLVSSAGIKEITRTYDLKDLLTDALSLVDNPDVTTELIFPSYTPGHLVYGKLWDVQWIIEYLVIDAARTTKVGSIVLACDVQKSSIKIWVVDNREPEEVQIFMQSNSEQDEYFGTLLTRINATAGAFDNSQMSDVCKYWNENTRGLTRWIEIPLNQLV